MPANLLILPLLAGYLFLHICTRYRYRSQALDGYRLLIESAIAGAVLLGISRVLVIALMTIAPWTAAVWQSVAPIPFLGTAAGSVILGTAIPLLDNRRPRLGLSRWIIRRALVPRRMAPLRRAAIKLRRAYQMNRWRAMDSQIRLHGNSLIRLLHHAATYELPVSVTLSSRKWYVGYIAESPNLEPAEACFRLLPLLSGYRDKDDLTARRVIYYSRDVYSKLEEDAGKKLDISVFVVTLPLKDVQDARIFDESVYRDHFSPERADAAKAS